MDDVICAIFLALINVVAENFFYREISYASVVNGGIT